MRLRPRDTATCPRSLGCSEGFELQLLAPGKQAVTHASEPKGEAVSPSSHHFPTHKHLPPHHPHGPCTGPRHRQLGLGRRPLGWPLCPQQSPLSCVAPGHFRTQRRPRLSSAHSQCITAPPHEHPSHWPVMLSPAPFHNGGTPLQEHGAASAVSEPFLCARGCWESSPCAVSLNPHHTTRVHTHFTGEDTEAQTS